MSSPYLENDNMIISYCSQNTYLINGILRGHLAFSVRFRRASCYDYSTISIRDLVCNVSPVCVQAALKLVECVCVYNCGWQAVPIVNDSDREGVPSDTRDRAWLRQPPSVSSGVPGSRHAEEVFRVQVESTVEQLVYSDHVSTPPTVVERGHVELPGSLWVWQVAELWDLLSRSPLHALDKPLVSPVKRSSHNIPVFQVGPEQSLEEHRQSRRVDQLEGSAYACQYLRCLADCCGGLLPKF